MGGWAEMCGTRKRSVCVCLRVSPLGGDMGGWAEMKFPVD